jgi:hypothetical protein
VCPDLSQWLAAIPSHSDIKNAPPRANSWPGGPGTVVGHRSGRRTPTHRTRLRPQRVAAMPSAQTPPSPCGNGFEGWLVDRAASLHSPTLLPWDRPPDPGLRPGSRTPLGTVRHNPLGAFNPTQSATSSTKPRGVSERDRAFSWRAGSTAALPGSACCPPIPCYNSSPHLT